MTLEKPPFTNYTLGEKDPIEQGKVFTVRLNAQEYRELLTAMAALNISSDSTALKELAFMGKNVVFTLLPLKTWKWLTDGERRVNESKLTRVSRRLNLNVTQENGNM